MTLPFVRVYVDTRVMTMLGTHRATEGPCSIVRLSIATTNSPCLLEKYNVLQVSVNSSLIIRQWQRPLLKHTRWCFLEVLLEKRKLLTVNSNKQYLAPIEYLLSHLP